MQYVCRAVPSASVERRLWDVATQSRRGTLVHLSGDQWLAVSGDGHYRGSPEIERELVYIVETDQGQEMLSPEAFAAKYGWKEDPDRVKLTP
jgi:hypothetical protein